MPKVMRSTLEGPGFEIEEDTSDNKCATAKKWLLFLLIFLFNLSDCVFDWLFFTDVMLTEPGLVYGPPSQAAWISILVFSVLGTGFFLLEATNLFCETCRGQNLVDPDVLSAVVVWLEDIPQIIISLSLALCREEAISVFQLIKAGTILISIIIRLIHLVYVNFCRQGRKPDYGRKWVKVIITVGAFLEAACSVAVFVLTQTVPTDNGVSFQVPSTIVEETYNHRTYFANVSVFVNHAQYFQPPGTDPARPLDLNWIRLASVDYVMKVKDDRLQLNLQYELEPNKQLLKLATWEKKGGEAWAMSGCYAVHQVQGSVLGVKDMSTCAEGGGFFTGASQNAFVTFKYTPPGSVFKRRLLGDITFNMMHHRGAAGDCVGVDNYSSSLYSASTNNIPLRFHYFQTAAHLPPQGTEHFLHDGNGGGSGTFRFFKSDGRDLKDINEVWKTGWLGCDSTGSLAPHQDQSIRVDCHRG